MSDSRISGQSFSLVDAPSEGPRTVDADAWPATVRAEPQAGLMKWLEQLLIDEKSQRAELSRCETLSKRHG